MFYINLIPGQLKQERYRQSRKQLLLFPIHRDSVTEKSIRTGDNLQKNKRTVQENGNDTKLTRKSPFLDTQNTDTNSARFQWHSTQLAEDIIKRKSAITVSMLNQSYISLPENIPAQGHRQWFILTTGQSFYISYIYLRFFKRELHVYRRFSYIYHKTNISTFSVLTPFFKGVL